ncbi:uncharacterized protein LOC128198267 [Bicyclus anynana]|uniref:Uncharacterized protein LOC128198267 n=1 Tax=Bicyclus anynana TaxID=110368 RepID=A0ABM3LHM9_BICAN|nr:uncharacterized protein LOC128198267 [Bicyclus anynana]
MSLKIQLYFTLTFISFAYSENIIIKLKTKQLIDSIISDTSVKYLTKLAQVFAKKAAETFIKEIKNREHLLDDSLRINSYSFLKKKPVHKIISTTTKRSATVEERLTEDEAYKLLDKPYPDGDNLGWHSQEKILDDEDTETKAIPVYGVMKVNGIYVRRLLGVGMI